MQRIIRINNITEQDDLRRSGTAQMSPNERVQATIELQARFLRWDLHPKIQRTAYLKRLDFKDV
jgi:hypothetical protein